MKNCVNKDYTIKRIEIERDFADDVFKKYRYKRYGIGNCCGSDFDDNVNKKALCDHDDNQLITYTDTTIKSVIYTPPEGGAEDDPNKPDWVNELCGMDHDEVQIYFYYDATSLGIPETIAAYTAAQAWVDNIKQDNDGPEYINCTNIEDNSIDVYHTTVFGERWLDWATSAMTGTFQNSGSCGGNGTIDQGGGGCVTGTAVNVDPDPARNFGTNDCGSAADSAFPATVNASSKFWGALQWAQSNGKTLYNGGAAGVNGGAFFPTVNTIGIAPAATAKNILVVCFIDESASPTHHQPYTGQQAGGGTALWSAATDNGTVTPCWAADHTEFIAQRNLYLATVEDSSANFYCYPSKPNSPGASHRAFPLHALGAITSGDQTIPDGTLTVAPYNFLLLLTAITTSNPYYAQGYGALDQHGWGINVDELPFTREGFSDDLDDYADITDCNDATCFVFKVVNQDGKPISCYNIILDGGNIGYTDDYGVLRYCIINASVDTKHTLQLCHCFTTTGECSSQNITITLTEECPVDACPAEPFIACEDPQVDPSGNELSGCLDPLSPNYCPDCTADCAGVVGGSDWSCCDYCADFQLSFSSTDATDDTTNDGTIDLTVSNGTAPYTYAWTGPGGFTAITEDLSGLAGGVYVVVVTDSSNPVCTETLTVYIDAPPSIVFGCMDQGTLCDEGMDVAFVIDYTSSMGAEIDQVKAGVASIITQIQSMVGASDYKLSLTIFDEYNADPALDPPASHPYSALAAYTGLPAGQKAVITQTTPSVDYPTGTFMLQYFTCMEMFGLNNDITFTAALNLLNTPSLVLGNSNAHSGPEPSDIAVDMVGTADFSGAWRTGVAKYIVLMTDNVAGGDNNSYDPATSPTELAAISSALLALDIKLIVVGNGANIEYPSFSGLFPMQIFADDTGGTWDIASVDYSTATNNSLATLCSPLPAACDYDPLATYDCAGILGGTDYSCCHYDACTDSSATNFDNTATTDCNCEPVGTWNIGWDSCCTYCVYGCMDPLASNYNPLADCEDTCTYKWTCTESTGSNDCENKTDTGVFGYEEDQLEHIALAMYNLQYTSVFSLIFEVNQSPLSNRCEGPNGGSMAYITSFGMNMPALWNMNPAGYTVWNDFITDLAATCFSSVTLNTSYTTIEIMMAAGCEGQYYTMEIEWEFCQCEDGGITTINYCEELGATDITTGNPTDTSTPYNWSVLISTTYPNVAAQDLYFCSTYMYPNANTWVCPCGDNGGGPTGNYYFNIEHFYDDQAGTVILGTVTQTWTGFVNDLISNSVPGVTAGMTYVDLQGLPMKAFLGMGWGWCTCTDAQGCTCIEDVSGNGQYDDQNDCETSANCCGNICGCLDPAASNYNLSANGDCADPCEVPTAGYGDTSCCNYLGCMDPLATNYDPQATIDDGSCEYKWLCQEGTATSDSCESKTIPAGELNIDSCNDLIEYLIDAPLHSADISTYKFCQPLTPVGQDGCPCDDPGDYYWYSNLFQLTDNNIGSGSTISATTWNALMALGDISLPGWNVDGGMTYAQVLVALTQFNGEWSTDWVLWCSSSNCICTGTDCECIEDPAGTHNNKIECEMSGDNCCDLECEPCNSTNNTTPGCCDILASNYNPLATCDDGTTCEYPTQLPGCMDCGYIYEASLYNTFYCNGVSPAITPGGFNYNAAAVINDGSCVYMACTDVLATNYNFDCNDYEFIGSNPLGELYTGFNYIDDGCCEYDNEMTWVPDQNFRTHLTNISQVSGWWDITGTVAGGEYCFTSEIDNFATLNLTDKGVADLTGLQDMVGLTTFVANSNDTGMNNTFTSVTSFIDTLSLLTHFEMRGVLNYYYSVPTIDFNGNPELSYVRIDYGILTILDFTQNPLLEHFICTYNNLTTVDVTQCPLLVWLRVRGNKIASMGDNTTEVDISQNPLIEYIGVAEQVIGNTTNRMNSLDISVQTVLTILIASVNDLTSLDTTNNTLLENLQINHNLIPSFDFSTNPLIYHLKVNSNSGLSSLWISNLSVLQLLNCEGNQLTTLDLSNNPALTDLNCRSNQIQVLDLSYNILLTKARCENNSMLCLNIQNGNNLNMVPINDMNLKFTGNSFTEISVDDPAYCTGAWTTALGIIDGGVTFNTLEPCDPPSGYTYIPDANFRERLDNAESPTWYNGDINSCYVLTSDINTLTTFVCNGITTPDPHGISDMTGLQDFTALEDLHVCCSINLTTLNVSQNVNLIELQIYANSLTTIDLSNNPLLEELRIYQNQLTSLDLSNNPALVLLQAFNNPNMTSIDISNNPALDSILVNGCALTSIDASSCTSLTTLNCQSNQLTYLNIANGNNINMGANPELQTISNNLTTITVDDPSVGGYAETTYTSGGGNPTIDAGVTFV